MFFKPVELLYNLFTYPQAAAEVVAPPRATSALGWELLIQVFILLLLTFLPVVF